MVLNAVLIAVGLLLAVITLSDVFETVVVPGGSRASLRIARRLVSLLLPVWKLARGRRRGVSGTFAPIILVGSFIIWMSLLAIGFAMVSYAVRSSFEPPLNSFWDALYLVASSLVTVGLSETNATGGARWIVVASGFCGLAVMTMAVTYLLQVQSSVARRDIGILKLNTSAGQPPSALTLLEKFAATDNRGELRDVLLEGRNWCLTVRQSHASHPSLIYFQSVGTGPGWPAALGALIDLTLIIECVLDNAELRGPAVLLCEDGENLAKEITTLTNLQPCSVSEDESAFNQIAERLRQVGYPVRAQPDLRGAARRRKELQSCVTALAEHLGKPAAVLLR